MSRPILVTGAAGFIGLYVAQRLLDRGERVIGIDDLNDYYDPRLKQARLGLLVDREGFTFHEMSVADREGMERVFEEHAPDRVVHLAAQAGVRYSLENPHAYVDANLVGFANILEGCRHGGVEHLVYASSSSVYGANRNAPFREDHGVDHPVSLYAATKKANEAMAHSYAHLYGLPVTGLRFFTVYGPWGRPDMAYFLFAEAIDEGRPIKLFNEGRMRRDFTFVEDIAEGVVRTLDQPAEPDPEWSAESPSPQSGAAPYRVYNIGNDRPTELTTFVETLERLFGQEAEKVLMPMQPGDVLETHASVDRLREAVGFQPKTSLDDGLAAFVAWYREVWLPIKRGEVSPEEIHQPTEA
ncbi:MAG: NAD-dependent epimerase [Bacteroidota bacterium]